jgi:mono/diheme cytochrome c family protein
VGLIGLALGCTGTSAVSAPGTPSTTTPSAQAAPAFDAESGPFAAGKKVFVASGCFRCHAINGIRGPVPDSPPMPGGPPGGQGPGGSGPMMGRGRAPDLGKVGQDPVHTADWLADHIRNPKSHKKESRMPPFENKIKAEDLRAVAEYLASLK